MLLFVSILCPHSGFSEVKVIKIILLRVTNVQQKCTQNRFLTVKKIKEIKSIKYLCINVITCISFDLLRLCFTPQYPLLPWFQNRFPMLTIGRHLHKLFYLLSLCASYLHQYRRLQHLLGEKRLIVHILLFP